MAVRRHWLGYACLLASFFLVSIGADRKAPKRSAPESSSSSEAPLVEVSKRSDLTPLQKQFVLSATSGADWLFRVHNADGRFVNGFVPALNRLLEGDHYLHQAGAALALARAARFNWDNRYAARATQAILTLLTETRVDAKQGSRFTILPSVIVNRLGAAGLTVAAIHELPAPQKDLLDQGEQFCVFIRRCQEKNGALRFSDNVHHKEGINEYPGQALYGLLLSQRHRPAKWKSDLAFHALPYYRSWWRENKNMDFVAWQSLAFTEAYLQTGNKEFADFVFEMNDWLVRLQYPPLDPRRPLWGGGFKSWSEGKEVETAPDIRSALYAESLAAAWRAAGRAGDLKRHQNYGEALQHCLQFLSRLQYTEANTQHFADWYRPRLLGAFHGSLEDGNIRVDYTQHAVYAMLLYLEGAVR